MKLDILAVAAHPDDVELSCSGTLAALIRSGKKAGVLDLTRGEMSTRGNPGRRLREAKKAADILELSVRDNAGLPDCGLENTFRQRESIIRSIRHYRPDICFINAPDDRHPDHRNASQLTLDALFYSGLNKLETRDESGNFQQPWRPHHILQYMQHWSFTPTLVFDITGTIDIKEEAIKVYTSQFLADDDDTESQTFISKKNFFDALRGRAREYGQQIGVTYGEPFLYYGGPIPVSDLNFLFSCKPQM